VARLSQNMILGRWSRSCLALHPSRPNIGALHPWSRNTFRGAATNCITTQSPLRFLRPFGHSARSSTNGRLAKIETHTCRRLGAVAVGLDGRLRNPECGRWRSPLTATPEWGRVARMVRSEGAEPPRPEGRVCCAWPIPPTQKSSERPVPRSGTAP